MDKVEEEKKRRGGEVYVDDLTGWMDQMIVQRIFG